MFKSLSLSSCLFSFLLFLFAIVFFAIPVSANEGIQDAVGVMIVDNVDMDCACIPYGVGSTIEFYEITEALSYIAEAVYAPNCRDVSLRTTDINNKII